MMKDILIKRGLFLIVLLSSFIFAKLNVVVSIPPQASFLKAIGGDLVDISVMVLPGAQPHSYEPKPSQMKAISRADLYFTIGVEFEKAWLPRFLAQNRKMKVIECTKGIKKIPMRGSKGRDDKKKPHHERLDPHIWLSPSNVKIMAKCIYRALAKSDKDHTAIYRKNYENFLKVIEQIDREIKSILAHLKSRSFIVFHPAFGYFAKEYDLRQIPIEIEGKAPKPKLLAYLIKEAKRHKARVIIVEPEFNDKAAKLIAKELNLRLVKISPLAADWSKNLIRLAKAIANGDLRSK